MLHIATGYMSILPSVGLQCIAAMHNHCSSQAAFQASQPQFRQLHPAALWGQEFLGGEEDLASMLRAGLRWLRFKVMKIRFGHVR